jgi:hypothetical protein
VNPVLTETQIGYLRSRQRARYIAVFDPCAVVFRARVAVVPDAADGTYLNIDYNTVSVGAYTDILDGMTYIISATTDHTQELYRGYVAAMPTSTTLPINEAAFPLSTSYYITVLDTYEVWQKVRKGALVGGHLAFERSAPTITGVPSVSFKESETTESFTLTALGQATEDGESIDSYEWSVLGETSSTDTITVDVPADTHVWGWVKVTDTLGTSTRLNFRLINRKRFGSTLPSAVCDNPRITRNWGGHHVSIRAYQGVSLSSLLNGCAMVIVSAVALEAGPVAIDPVVFVGYLTKEANNSESITDKSVSFEASSPWEIASQSAMNQIAVRDSATPTVWDQLNYPTPQRVTAHILSRYSTVLNVCGLNLDDVDSTWYSGEANVKSNSIGDAVNDFVLSEINAHVTSAASGELYVRRDLRYTDTDTRDDADVVWTLTKTDISSLNYTARHDEKTGRVIIGFRTFYTNRSPSKGGKGVAPAVTLGRSPETQTRPNQLLPADLSDADTLMAAAERVGNILAAENTPFELGASVRPQLQYLNPNNFQWLTLSLPASVMTRGRALTVRALLASLELDYDVRLQRIGVTITLIPETQGGAAIIVAMLSPNASSLTGVITPPLGAYGGSFPMPSTLNLPDGDTERPFSRRDMSGMGPPMPADQAADEGRRQVQGNKRTFAISFKNPDPVAAGFLSVNSATYRITVSGTAYIGTGRLTLDYNFLEDDYADQGISGDVDGNTAGWTLGQGWGGTTVGAEDRCYVKKTFDDPTPVISVTEYWDGFTDDTNANYRIGINGSFGAVNTMTLGQTSGGVTINDTADYLYAGFERSGFITDFVAYLIRLVIVVAAGGGDLFADAFYSFEKGEEEDEGEDINVEYLGSDRGLMINGSPVAVPPVYNPNHEYTFEWTGDGNNPTFVWMDDDYSDNTNALLYITIEGPNASI